MWGEQESGKARTSVVVMSKLGRTGSKYALKGAPKRLNLLGKRQMLKMTSRFLPERC